MDLSDWKGVPRPERIVLEGRYARLEPLDPAKHSDDLLASALEPGADDRFRYLFEEKPADMASGSRRPRLRSIRCSSRSSTRRPDGPKGGRR
jgi:hypothetical protein